MQLVPSPARPSFNLPLLIWTLTLIGSAFALDPKLQLELERIQNKAKAAAEKVDTDAASDAIEDKQMAGLLASYTDLSRGIGTQEEEKELLVYRCKYVQATAARRVLEGFVTSRGTVADSSESDVVIVTDAKSNMPRLKTILQELDHYTPQVLVEARIVELTVDSDFEKEIELAYENIGQDSAFVQGVSSVLKTPGANPNTGEGSLINVLPWKSGTDSLTAFLRYLETRGRASILSNPNLILSRGSEGSIVTGEEVPILTQTVTSGSVSTSTQFKSVGIKLKVTPLMITEDTVRVRINPEVSTVTGFSSAGEGVSNPIIAIRQARTELRVKDGELVSIGGLLRSEERVVNKRTPVLSTIPVVGEAFKSTRKEMVQTQLVIFLTIRILPEGEVGGSQIIRPQAQPKRVTDEIEKMGNNDGLEPPTLKKDLKQLLGTDAP